MRPNILHRAWIALAREFIKLLTDWIADMEAGRQPAYDLGYLGERLSATKNRIDDAFLAGNWKALSAYLTEDEIRREQEYRNRSSKPL
jgi:hypothetical protein